MSRKGHSSYDRKKIIECLENWKNMDNNSTFEQQIFSKIPCARLKGEK